jgi:hypothetical protein
MPAPESRPSCRAAKLGQGAFDAIQKGKSAEVIGTTSRGLFLLTDESAIIFLTSEFFCGPLTVIIPQVEFNLKAIQKGDRCWLKDGRILFDGVTINVPAENLWQPMKPGGGLLTGKERLSLLGQIGRRTAQVQNEPGFGRCLPTLLNGNFAGGSGIPETEQNLVQRLLELEQALEKRNWGEAEIRMISFLGQGRGLTPAGDDFIEGSLLATNRWTEALGITEDLTSFNKQIMSSARKTTTTLSANLIEQAVVGQADERLVMVLDSIMVGNSGVEDCVQNVLSIGYSSGVDALVGLTVVIKAMTRN